MERKKQARGTHATFRQKKRLLECITKHPELISCRVTQDFNYQDSQKLWQTIANELNNIPGARKTWKQWRKTWQDLRSSTKKRIETQNKDIPPHLMMLTQAEQEALGIKPGDSSSTSFQDLPEFVPLEENNGQDNNFLMEMENPTLSEPESPPEAKVFTREHKIPKIKNHSKKNSDHSNCAFNCDLLAMNEQRKIQLKEDYINFKKDYLKQKLKLIKEQTEALKTIAREMCENK